ncbi:DnaJ family domain-containing protein [Nocardioides aurantiacus]|uniref:DnaJ family domain-containing protein n=1 Tax=Nocardioides aurantiacus TaxID=86796 RepID=UPI00403F42AF
MDDAPSNEAERDRRYGRTPQQQDARTGRSAASQRIQHQARWVDLQIQRAMERGEFDDLPGQGKPLADLGSPGDRDWWLKKLIEREQITGVLPEALQLRKEDGELDAVLDRETAEQRVRDVVDGFNRRVVAARRQLQGGPPVVTPTRDPDVEVRRWAERRDARVRANAAAVRAAQDADRRQERPRRWWRRR